MGTLTEDEAKAALDLPHLRKLAVKSFNDAEMARGIASLKGGTLLQKLRWMIAEDVTDLARVWPLLVDKSVPAKEKTALYPQNDVRVLLHRDLQRRRDGVGRRRAGRRRSCRSCTGCCSRARRGRP